MLQDQEQKMNRIAIIGSGITGISVAFQHPPNSHITMFDKSRKPGGRISTRTSRQHPGYSFDHGAPFVYAKGQFLDFLKKINAVNQVKLQKIDFTNKNQPKTSQRICYGGTPSIQSVPLKLIEQLKKKHKFNLQFDTRINLVEDNQQKGKFLLRSEENKQFGPYDQVYVCIPYPQCLTLKQNFVKFSQQFQKSTHYFCNWAIMAAFDKKSVVSNKLKGVDVCTNIGSNIQIMVNQKLKGNTAQDDLWVFYMNQKWCQENINLKPQNVEQQLKKSLQNIFDKDIQYKYLKAHRWLYSKPKNTPNQPIVGKNIVFGADWIGQKTSINQCWELGPLLYKTMNQNKSNL